MIDENKLLEEINKVSPATHGGTDEIILKVINECKKKFTQIIKGQPQIMNWCSTKETLPEPYKPVLVTLYRENDNFKKITTAHLTDEGGWKIEFGGFCGLEHIIAWAPLPQPFESERI